MGGSLRTGHASFFPNRECVSTFLAYAIAIGFIKYHGSRFTKTVSLADDCSSTRREKGRGFDSTAGFGRTGPDQDGLVVVKQEKEQRFSMDAANTLPAEWGNGDDEKKDDDEEDDTGLMLLRQVIRNLPPASPPPSTRGWGPTKATIRWKHRVLKSRIGGTLRLDYPKHFSNHSAVSNLLVRAVQSVLVVEYGYAVKKTLSLANDDDYDNSNNNNHSPTNGNNHAVKMGATAAAVTTGSSHSSSLNKKKKIKDHYLMTDMGINGKSPAAVKFNSAWEEKGAPFHRAAHLVTMMKMTTWRCCVKSW